MIEQEYSSSQLGTAVVIVSKGAEGRSSVVEALIHRFKLKNFDLIDRDTCRYFSLSKGNSIYSDIDQGKISTVVVKSIDDICNGISDEDDLLSLLCLMSEKEIRFISIDEGVDLMGSQSKLALMVLNRYRRAAFQTKSANVRSGIQKAKKSGKTLGRPAKRDQQKIKQLRLQGLTIQKIADLLKISVGSVHRSLVDI